jgi:glycosyltransferase involved in cell wall biosynthesis
MPLISIVTVSLDAAATIEDTLASVALQDTDFPVEHLCVDGGSADATREIIDRWAERSNNISRIYEPDDGIFDAMNKGLRAAAGEYVLYLNADDFLVSPKTLSMAMQGISPGAPGNPGLIVGDAAMGRLGHRGFWRHRRVPKLLGRLCGVGLYPVHQGRFTQRRLLEAVGGFDASQRLGADLTQYYDLERIYRPATRRLGADIAFMQAGGAANRGVMAMYRGSVEIYRHIASTGGAARACATVLGKSLQSLCETRYGRCTYHRWFSHAIDNPPTRSLGSASRRAAA